jgi:hypothetical protein
VLGYVCREAEHTLLESIRHWRPKFLEWSEKVVSKLVLLKALRIDLAARKVTGLFRLARDCHRDWARQQANVETEADVEDDRELLQLQCDAGAAEEP